jgi:hypothetical protein
MKISVWLCGVAIPFRYLIFTVGTTSPNRKEAQQHLKISFPFVRHAIRQWVHRIRLMSGISSAAKNLDGSAVQLKHLLYLQVSYQVDK